MAQSLLGPAHAQRIPDGLVRAVLQTVAERSKLQWRLRKSHVSATVCEIASSCQHKMRRANTAKDKSEVTMTRALLTGIAALFLATSATTARTGTPVMLNNKEIIGEWCASKADTELFFSSKSREDCGAGALNIQINGIEGWEHGCQYTAVKTWYDPTIPTATKTPTGALVSRIEMICTGEGYTWRERVTVHLGKGFLSYKSNWRSKAKRVK
jgi:hypothetical protein